MKQETLALLKYFPHIDGLRALAVLSVIVFHLAPDIFPGGYLGVDIFFVISGFVISQSLYKSYLQNGKLNIGNFYIRRFKRLYPALLVMVSVTSVFYILFGGYKLIY
jgi:peptidoglycan/LPS O-acetylase OafA/YrhL